MEFVVGTTSGRVDDRRSIDIISQPTRCALKVVIALAADLPRRPRSARDLAAQTRIPQPFLEQILLDLARGGTVRSTRGRHGGYELARSLEAISIADLLASGQHRAAMLGCVASDPKPRCLDCPPGDACMLRRIFERVHQAHHAVLDRTTLRDAVQGSDGSSPDLEQPETGEPDLFQRRAPMG